jgi:CDP-4-dehydro-6-deoxyglucose reductase
MPQLLNLSRAARLVGATRGALQARIQSGELSACDGMVSVEELQRLFPEAQVEEAGAFERVTRIKEESFGRRVRERTLPSQEILSQRLFDQSLELSDLRTHLQRYHALVLRLEERIDQLAEQSGAEARTALADLRRLLDHEFEEALGRPGTPNALSLMDDMLRVMSAQVVVHPSRHEFFVDGADTILDAALSAGLALNYGCSSGNCGLCKARVVSGQVKRIRHHDYVLSEAEKLQGYTLLCSHTAVSDLVIEALEAQTPGDIPQQQIGARIKALGWLADDLMLLHLQTPRTNRLRFLAGQSVTLSVPGAEPMRLPVASCPCDDRNLQFHIERDSDHSFAERVFCSLGQGDPVTVWGPWGDFVLRPESTRSILFLVCDTGFAHVKSLVEHAMARDAAEHIHLYWLATRPSGHYLANLCRSWAAALDKFHFHPLMATPAGGSACAGGAAELGRRLVQEQDRLKDLDAYIAGPGDFVAALETFLQGRGLPRARISSTVV